MTLRQRSAGRLVPIALFLVASGASADGGAVSDREVMQIIVTHCTACHARHPTNPSLQEPPKDVTLESVEDLRRFALQILTQVVVNKAMPMGNQTEMTDAERTKIGRWVAAQK